MKHFNFLSNLLSLLRAHRVHTLALTVGSPLAHRRGTMLRLCSVVAILLTIGVGNAWGAGAISVTSSAITLPKGSTSVSTGDWIDAAGVTKAGSSWAYSDWNGDQTIGSYGSITFDQAGDLNGADLLQFQKSGGNISTTISSPAGVDIVIGYKVGNNSFSVSLTGAAASVSGSSTSWSTMSISTTNTSATLTITKTNKGAGYVSYITITPKAAASCSANPTAGTASLNGSFFWTTLFEPLCLENSKSYAFPINCLIISALLRILSTLIYTMYISR